jgi:hypothetical protein
MQNSIYSHKNEKRGRLECLAPCGPKKETCRFHVNFRRVKDTTCACISSCFLSHDCQTGIGLKSINCTDIPTKKRRRNHRLKFVIQIQDLLSHYLQSVDLTKNDGMTVKHLIKSAYNNKLGLVSTDNQAKFFCKSFNNDIFPYHTRQFAQTISEVDP